MALINCPECGKQISDQAKDCPNCGFPIAQNLRYIVRSTTQPPQDDIQDTTAQDDVQRTTNQDTITETEPYYYPEEKTPREIFDENPSRYWLYPHKRYWLFTYIKSKNAHPLLAFKILAWRVLVFVLIFICFCIDLFIFDDDFKTLLYIILFVSLFLLLWKLLSTITIWFVVRSCYTLYEFNNQNKYKWMMNLYYIIFALIVAYCAWQGHEKHKLFEELLQNPELWRLYGFTVQ